MDAAEPAVILLGRATAHTKLPNFASNLAALLCFLPGRRLVWEIGLAMGAGQLIGAWIGSHLVLRHGTRLVPPVLVAVSLAISVKLLLDGGWDQNRCSTYLVGAAQRTLPDRKLVGKT